MAIKYCPECRAEYQEWVEKCPDCGAALTDIKPGAKAKPDKDGGKYAHQPLVTIGAFANSIEAQFSKGILESEGIPSMITSTDSIIAYQPDASAVGNIHLVVKESDAAKAKEILDSIVKDVPEDGIIDEEIPGDNDPNASPG
jgi:hypothetical protein